LTEQQDVLNMGSIKAKFEALDVLEVTQGNDKMQS
jgi:hypothetical protein